MRIEQLADDLMVHRRTGDQPAQLRRVGRGADEPSGRRIFNEKIDKKLRRAFHERIGAFRQERLVFRE